MKTHFDHVSVSKEANVYADGKCISHNLTFPDGTKKTLGVIMPSSLTFGTDSPEIMEIVQGKCRTRIGETGEWQDYESGQRFHLPASCSYQLETKEPLHYVCHFVHA
jgi:uncharacterized protein YaiE (UPF0345 family)